MAEGPRPVGHLVCDPYVVTRVYGPRPPLPEYKVTVAVTLLVRVTVLWYTPRQVNPRSRLLCVQGPGPSPHPGEWGTGASGLR